MLSVFKGVMVYKIPNIRIHSFFDLLLELRAA
jgi:hypothetical protein